jgi:predicted GTPase
MNNLDHFSELLSALQHHASILDTEQFGELKATLSNLHNNLDSIREKGRNLRIAVVGQMKAGKSSFLNAAFFNSDLLPKADTPMTAALTRITYSPTAHAEVVFYSQQDWDSVVQRDREYLSLYAEEERKLIEESQVGSFGKLRKPTKYEVDARIPEAVKASVELVAKAREHRLDVNAYLGKTQVLDGYDSPQELAKALHEYVGSGGRFTAITQRTELYINDQRLEGLDIIDTPGFNDPVISRGQVTRQYLSQCDVIFLLSSLSQFITSTDMSLLREQLSAAGISERAVFLIGSQRDVALRQDQNISRTAAEMAERYPADQRTGAKVAAMMQLLDKQMGIYANSTLENQIQRPGLDDKTRSILQAVKNNKPHFISSWSWLLAENFNRMSPDDRDQWQRLCQATGYDFDPDSLRHLSNIPAVRDELLRQREHKKQLILGKEQELLTGVRNSCVLMLKKLRTGLQERSTRIQNGDMTQLEKTERDTLKRLERGQTKLESVFDEQLHKTLTKFAMLRTDVRTSAQKYASLNVIKETERVSYEVSTSRWYNPFSWGGTETRYRDVVTVYANAQDAIEQVEEFALNSTRTLQEAIINCMDLDGLRRRVGQAAMALFDTSDASFDGELMMSEVSKSLRRITIPDVDFGDKDYSQSIANAFGSGRVSESRISGLKEAQLVAVKAIISDLEKEVARKVNAIQTNLETASKTFVTQMSQDIQASLTQLRKDIAEKEQSVRRINEAQKTIDQCLASW